MQIVQKSRHILLLWLGTTIILGLEDQMVSVMNSINKGKGAHQKKSEARSIGNSEYKNLKLKKKEEERELKVLKYKRR